MASDLQRFFHRRIADWHSGVMSSFELLELFGVDIVEDAGSKTRTISVAFAPEDGALATALRGDDLPEWKQMIRQTANEVAVLRAGMVQGTEGDSYGSRLWYSPAKTRELIAEAQAREEAQESVYVFADRTRRKEIEA